MLPRGLSGRKRANGEGGVHKRQDGRWVAQWTLGEGPDGKRQTRTTHHKLKREAVEAFATARQERGRGQLVVGAKTTIGEYLDGWLTVIPPQSDLRRFVPLRRRFQADSEPKTPSTAQGSPA
jgi:hypothetical protein